MIGKITYFYENYYRITFRAHFKYFSPGELEARKISPLCQFVSRGASGIRELLPCDALKGIHLPLRQAGASLSAGVR